MKNIIIVGNVGTVLETDSDQLARVDYVEWARIAREESHSRAYGESVTWMRDGEVYREQMEREGA